MQIVAFVVLNLYSRLSLGVVMLYLLTHQLRHMVALVWLLRIVGHSTVLLRGEIDQFTNGE